MENFDRKEKILETIPKKVIESIQRKKKMNARLSVHKENRL